MLIYFLTFDLDTGKKNVLLKKLQENNIYFAIRIQIKSHCDEHFSLWGIAGAWKA